MSTLDQLPLPAVTDSPFPHIAQGGVFDSGLLGAVSTEFPSPGDPRWRRYSNGQEAKFEGSDPAMWGPATRQLLDEMAGLGPALETRFGVEGLVCDTVGGGYHLIPPGGRLAMHADFNRHPTTGWYRRLNLLVYLNPAWRDEGGWLYLGEEGSRVGYPPEFGTVVAFETSDTSWHGHPVPARRWRQSVAAYFFTKDPPPGYSEDHSTVWLADG